MSKCRCAVSPIPLCTDSCAVSSIPLYSESRTKTLSHSESSTIPLISLYSESQAMALTMAHTMALSHSESSTIPLISLYSESHAMAHTMALSYSESSTVSPIPRLKRRVRFAAEHQRLYFHPTRPVFKMTKPVCRIALAPINCAEETGTGCWLADLQGMRQAPFCRLDYLRVKSVTEEESATLNESAFLMDEASCDAMIEGEVAALNLDYKKEIYIHYTLDSWKSQSVAMASYVSSVSTLRIDKFHFTIPLPDRMNDFILQLAIKYCVGGKTYWDNFNCQNYQFCGIVEEEDGQVLLEDLAGGHETNAVTEMVTNAVAVTIKNSVTKPQPIPIPTRLSPINLKMNYSKSATDVPFLGSNRGIPGHAASWTCTKSFTVQAGFTRSRALTTMPLDGIPFFMA